jgi:hypothetical protein
MLLHIIEKIHNGNIKILYYVVISILTGPHSQYLVVGQGMKQTLLYLWCPYLKKLKNFDDVSFRELVISDFFFTK